MKLEHTPLPVTRFDQRFEFALGVSPVQQLVDQSAVDLAGAILPHPHFFELTQAQKQTHPLHVRFIALSRIGIDQPIVAWLANDQPLHQRSHDSTGPARERPRFQSQMQRSPLLFECSNLRPKYVRLGRKTHPWLRPAIMIHTAQHAVTTVQIQCCVKRSLHFHGVDLYQLALLDFATPTKPQLMTIQPTAPFRIKSSMFATTPWISSRCPASLVRFASSRSRTPAVKLFNASRGLSLSR